MSSAALLLRVLLFVVSLVACASPHAPADRESPIDRQARKAGVDPRWWREVSARLERAEYEVSASVAGLQAPNRAQNLRTRFCENGIEVVPRTGEASWRFTWSTEAWGRADRLTALGRATPSASASRVHYGHSAFEEWYENGPEGIEQGFAVARRPSGEGALRVVGRLGGTLRPTIRGGAVELLDAAGKVLLRYADLHVFDRRGKEMPSRLELSGARLAILVDDRNAEYPLTIDPLMTSPAWIAKSDQDGALLGFPVAGAGDVNGDGYSDVIVGAYLYDNGQTDEGKVYVYHGSATGMPPAPSWTAEGNQAFSKFGSALTSAGDVDRDGFSDVVVGAYGYDNGQTDEGRVFLYRGSASGLLVAPSWTAEANQADARFGAAVAAAGDVNGDGYSDVVVGAYYYDNGQTDEGGAFLYHGSSAGLGPAPAWTYEGNQANSHFGGAVAGAGDVNADGYADVLVSAYHYDGSFVDEGRVLGFHGSASGLTVLNWFAEGTQTSELFADDIASAGDVNGDGYADVVVGAPYYDNGQGDEGAVFLYRGGFGGLSFTPSWTGEGGQNDAHYGGKVASAGDVNGDGFADVIVGAYDFDNGQTNEGKAFVYQGSGSGLGLVPDWTGESNQAEARYAVSVASAGDVNGDGYSDVFVGAYAYDFDQVDDGAAFVYYGASTGLASATPAWIVEGNQVDAFMGSSVASAGDVNADGYSDVVVGAEYYDNGETNEGRAFLYLGSPNGPGTSPTWTAEGDQNNAWFGYSASSAGDVNGDGYGDVIVGAYGASRAFVFHGTASGLSATAAWGPSPGYSFGRSVGCAGDVNGDGYSDVIVGAYDLSNGQPDEGGVFVYLGSSAGLPLTADWAVESNQAGALLGASVAGAGDVNRDGYSDVIVGATGYDNGETDEGRVLAYHGSSTGLATSPAWFVEGNQTNAMIGFSVSSAGDVNGDAFSDVIVGAHLYDNAGFEGAAFVYHGGAAGLATSPAWIGGINQAATLYGFSVRGAGDVNGDGYSDVVVGAPWYDNGENQEGRALVYGGSAGGLAVSPTSAIESNDAGSLLGHSVSSAGDVNGDGYSDLVVGVWQHNNGQTNEGGAYLYYGNGGDGLDRAPRQLTVSPPMTAIALLGKSDSGAGFRIHARGRTPAGRGWVRLQHEVKPLGVPFNGMGLVTGEPQQTPGGSAAALLTQLAFGLSPNTPYQWRARILTDWPAAPRSPWFSMPGNAPTETDLRSGTTNVGVPEAVEGTRQPRIDSAGPNPSRGATDLRYTLPSRGRLRLAIFDVTGRQVALLVDRVEDAGAHSARWDGPGRAIGSGVYLAKLTFGDRTVSHKIVRTR
jgi:hypothetical protein